MLRIVARKAEFRLERDVVSKSSFKTFVNRILRRINEIVDELELIAVPCVLDWKNLLEYLVQTFILSVLGGSVKLEEVLE